VANDGGAAQALEDADLNFLGPESDQSIKAVSEGFQGFARKTHDQIGMQVHAAVLPKPLEVVGESIVVLSSTNPGFDLPIEGLDADLELQRARRESGDEFPQLRGQPVRNHFEMDEEFRAETVEEELKDPSAGGEVEVEGPVDELETTQAPVVQSLH
jgi:hypothetical protein